MQQAAPVRLYGKRGCPSAYAIRDFLHRSDIPFEWIELRDDEHARKELGVENVDDARLPICIFDDGTRMERPTVRQITERAARLGPAPKSRTISASPKASVAPTLPSVRGSRHPGLAPKSSFTERACAANSPLARGSSISTTGPRSSLAFQSVPQAWSTVVLAYQTRKSCSAPASIMGLAQARPNFVAMNTSSSWVRAILPHKPRCTLPATLARSVSS